MRALQCTDGEEIRLGTVPFAGRDRLIIFPAPSPALAARRFALVRTRRLLLVSPGLAFARRLCLAFLFAIILAWRRIPLAVFVPLGAAFALRLRFDQFDPDIAYNQLVRPGKSLLGLFYIDHRSNWCDLLLCWLTVVEILSRPRALAGVHRMLERLGAPALVLEIAARQKPLTPMSPPGAAEIVTSRG